ncbi:hypothetical protein ABC337_15300 [Arthrobacter sp. 1P04PC]|uniref:hypothetical protein n=1 Tax=Arthrobacter sp. 1P04PC TaxID=3132262 RepID=UPI0039A22104
MSKTSTRLAGHELHYEGAPHDKQGRPINSVWGGTAGVGRAKCTCGKLSPELTSGTKRKAWHRDHKDEIRNASEARA